MLKAGAACLLALSLVAASVGAAEAASTRKGKRVQSSPAAAAPAQSRNPMTQSSYNGYYERIENRVPFGSKIWWDVYSSMPRGG